MKNQTKKDRPTFVGFRPQYFKHKDDKKEVRNRNKKLLDNYKKGLDY